WSPHREASSQSAPLNDAFVVSLTSNLLAYLGSETLITAGPIQQWQTTRTAVSTNAVDKWSHIVVLVQRTWAACRYKLDKPATKSV
ncbi:MAG: hypothetical protein NXI04_21325, partial [Planctomycetaceae bacterium]|nr:hypothetical protein [Planctomycetaceae bacterium]